MQRVRRGVVAAVATLGVIATVAAYLATQQSDAANEARARAEIEAETAKQTTSFMTGLFNVADPSEALGNTITAKEVLDKGAARINRELTGQPAIQSTLMETIGTVYTSLGLYPQAIPLLRSALEKRRALYGEKHVEVARRWTGSARPSSSKRNTRPRRACARGAGDSPRIARQRATPRRLEASMSSPIFWAAWATIAAAEPLFREALTLRKKLFGARKPRGGAKPGGPGAEPLRPGQVPGLGRAAARCRRHCAASCIMGRILSSPKRSTTWAS